jgi:hypothetical protein
MEGKFDQMVERACHTVMEKYKQHHAMSQEHDRMLELAGTPSSQQTTAMDRVREKAQSRQGSDFSESADLTAMLRIAGLR